MKPSARQVLSAAIGDTPHDTPVRTVDASQDVLESLHDQALIVDGDLNVLYANGAAREAAHAQGKTLRNRKIWEALPGFADTSLAARLRRAMAEGRSQSFHTHDPATGHPATIRCHPSPAGLLVFIHPESDTTAIAEFGGESARLGLLELAQAGFSTGYFDVELDPENPEEIPAGAFISPSQKRLIGFEDHEFPNSLMAWRERIVPEDLEDLKERALRHLRGDLEHFECQYRIHHRDGSLRWLLVRGDVTRDRNGRPLRWSGITVDNTDHEYRQQALAELSVIVAASDAAIISCSPDGKINTWNAGAQRMYGYTRQEAMGRNYAMLLPASRVGSPQFLRRMKQGGRYQQLETIRRRKDGMLINVSVCLSPILDDEGRHVASSLIEHDITQRKNMQEALRRSEARFRSIFNQASVGIAQLGGDGLIEMVNPRLCEILGRRRADLLNHRIDGMTHPDERFDIATHLTRLREGEDDVFSRELRCVASNGEMIWAYMTVTVGESPGNQRNAFIAIMEDISKRKETEEDLRRALTQLRELNLDLEHRIARRTESLTRKQNILQELLAQLNDAEQEERRRLAGQLHDYLPQILVAAKMKLARVQRLVRTQRASELLNDVTGNLDDCLKYCRTLISELSPSVLYEFGLEAALPTLVGMMRELGLSVELRSYGEPGPLPEQTAGFLYRAVRELLYNAAKYAEAPGATVEIDWRSSPLRVTVSDEGIGFDLTTVRQTQMERGSFGLLNIEQRLETLGGELQIDSRPGEGTRITLVTPVEDERATVEGQTGMADVSLKGDGESAPRSVPTHPGILRVLIADDHEMVRHGLRSVMESWPHVEIVGEAADGAEAVALALSRKPDVVLMDAHMPVMDGAEATRRIRSEIPETCVVGISSQVTSDLEEAMTRAGAVCVLPKELEPAELRRAINEHYQTDSTPPGGNSSEEESRPSTERTTHGNL